jgi:hypothetical protein
MFDFDAAAKGEKRKKEKRLPPSFEESGFYKSSGRHTDFF